MPPNSLLETRHILRIHENILEGTVKGDIITTVLFPFIIAKFPGSKNKGDKFTQWPQYIKWSVTVYCSQLEAIYKTQKPVKLSFHLHQNWIKCLSVAIGAEHLQRRLEFVARTMLRGYSLSCFVSQSDSLSPSLSLYLNLSATFLFSCLIHFSLSRICSL